LSEAIIPLLNENGKIITVGSTYGNMQLPRNSEEWKVKFTNPSITKDQLLSYLKAFEDSVKNGDYAEKGFPNSEYKIYGMSKLGINIYTMRILSQRQDIKDKHIQVYAQCPGYVKTDLNNNQGHLTIEEGAKTTLFLLDLPFEVNK
jgi:NAD(P)-dependent dehydrogenase (short-subunit alcohol dehydrogenase family)